MSIQRYKLALNKVRTQGHDMTVPDIEPYPRGDLVKFDDHAAALAKSREAAFRDFIARRGVDVPCQSCRGLGTRAYGSTATWHGGAGGQTVTTDICDLCWGSGDDVRLGVNLRTLTTKDAEVAAAVAKEREECAQLVLDFRAIASDGGPYARGWNKVCELASHAIRSRPTPGAAKEESTP